MVNFAKAKQTFDESGFVVIANVFSNDDVQKIINFIDAATADNPSFRKAANLFAIRQVLKELPEIQSLVFTNHLREVIKQFFGNDFCGQVNLF